MNAKEFHKDRFVSRGRFLCLSWYRKPSLHKSQWTQYKLEKWAKITKNWGKVSYLRFETVPLSFYCFAAYVHSNIKDGTKSNTCFKLTCCSKEGKDPQDFHFVSWCDTNLCGTFQRTLSLFISFLGILSLPSKAHQLHTSQGLAQLHSSPCTYGDSIIPRGLTFKESTRSNGKKQADASLPFSLRALPWYSFCLLEWLWNLSKIFVLQDLGHS